MTREASARTATTLPTRRVQFNLDNTPLHWLPGDNFSSHTINGIHLLLPAGEFWFCRVYNKALPLVTDPVLREEMIGFIRQEGMHARVHKEAQKYLTRHGIETETYLKRVDRLFSKVLGDKPLGLSGLSGPRIDKHWLIIRVGIIATIEHFTGVLGQWAMDNKSWDAGDPVMVDVFRWHLAEEVEHRTVAFDVYEHLCKNEPAFYLSRQALMAVIFPLFIHFLLEGYRSMARQDVSDPVSQRLARKPFWTLIREVERVGKLTHNIPQFSFLVSATKRWISPSFHPIHEGNTEQALSYLARSPAAQAAALAAAT
mgnify:CR=1 FL=1